MDPQTLQQSIATLNTCINRRITATFRHRPCGGGCCCGDATMFDYLILDAVNSPLLTVALSAEEIDCVIAMAQCGDRFPPPPTPDTCVACTYAFYMLIPQGEACNYTYTFYAKTLEVVSYTKNGVVTVVNEPIGSDINLLLAFLQSLDPTFNVAQSGASYIASIPLTNDIYSFDITGTSGMPDMTVEAVEVSCGIIYSLPVGAFYIYSFNGTEVNTLIADYDALVAFFVAQGFEVFHERESFVIVSTCTQYSTIVFGYPNLTSVSCGELATYWDISGFVYPNSFQITIDAVETNFYVANQAALLVALNAIGTGVFSIVGDYLIVCGNYTFGDLESRNLSYDGYGIFLPLSTTVLIDGVYYYLGTPANLAAVVVSLNAIGIGTWATLPTVTVYGFNDFGPITIGQGHYPIGVSFTYPLTYQLVVGADVYALGVMANEAALLVTLNTLNIGYFFATGVGAGRKIVVNGIEDYSGWLTSGAATVVFVLDALASISPVEHYAVVSPEVPFTADALVEDCHEIPET